MKQFLDNHAVPIFLVVLFFGGLIGIAALRNVSNQNRKQLSTIKPNPQSTMSADERQQKEIQKMLANNTPVKCVFSQTLPNATISGSMWIYNKEVRLDVTAPDNMGVEKTTHTIYKKDKMYLWYEKSLAGMIKNLVNAEEVTQTTTSVANPFSTLKGVLGLIDGLQYQCDSWELDKFMFTPPPEVSFINADELMKQVNQGLCEKCDQENTQASRLLCRKMIKCDQ